MRTYDFPSQSTAEIFELMEMATRESGAGYLVYRAVDAAESGQEAEAAATEAERVAGVVHELVYEACAELRQRYGG